MSNLKPYPDDIFEDISPQLKRKLERMKALLDEYGINYGQKDNKDLPKLNLKKGYPNYSEQYMGKPHDLNKWIKALKNIYYKEKDGISRQSAVQSITKGWHFTEVFDFINWLKYYEEKDHMKYKVAQVWYENPNTPGYFLHLNKNDEQKQYAVKTQDIDNVATSVSNDLSASEKKQLIEKQRHKIIGRLDSAEKLLRSNEGHLFAGNELETLIDIIYSLKKKIQLINKQSSSMKTYEDVMIREANILTKNGFYKSADFVYALAQDLSATPANPPTEVSGGPGLNFGPGMPQNPPESAPNDGSVAVLNQSQQQPEEQEQPNLSKGITDFLDRMEGGNLTEISDATDDELEVQDDMPSEDFLIEAFDNNDLVVFAQDAQPIPQTQPEATLPDSQEKQPETSVQPTAQDLTETVPASTVLPKPDLFDAALSQALANITVQDVILKLEDLSKIFGTREIPRQLALVDLMLNQLNLGVFSELSEAQTKALDSNNYVKIRIDDILNKIRATLPTDINLHGNENKSQDPTAEAVRSKIISDDEKERLRKQKRKDMENQTFDAVQNQQQQPKENANIELPAQEPTKEEPPPQAQPQQPPQAAI